MSDDPPPGLFRQRLRFRLSGNTVRQEEQKMVELVWRVAQLPLKSGGLDHVRAEAVVQVIAEAAGVQFAGKIAIGGGDDLS